MRSVVYKVNYFAIFVLFTMLISMSLLALALFHEPPLGRQLAVTAQDTMQTKVRIGNIHYDEKTQTVTVENISISNPPGFPDGPAMSFGRFILRVGSEDIGRHPLWGQTKREFVVTMAQVENVRVFLRVRPETTNISALLRGIEVTASVKYHTKPGRAPVTLTLGDIFAPQQFDVIAEDGKTMRLPSGSLKELLQINHDGGALASEAMAGVVRAFGRVALTEAAKRDMLKGLNKKGLEEITDAFNPAEQGQNRLHEFTRAMAKRLTFVFRNY